MMSEETIQALKGLIERWESQINQPHYTGNPDLERGMDMGLQEAIDDVETLIMESKR